jgi:hypothetical protein
MSESSINVLENNGKVKLAGFLEKRLVNHNVIHKHVTPYENPRSEVVAQIDLAEIREFVDPKDNKKKKGLYTETDYLLDITPFQRDTIEYVTLKDKVKNPIEFSIGKQKFGKKGEVPDYSVPLELTLTTIPYCKDNCYASVKKMEKPEMEARILELEKALQGAVGKADKFEKLYKKATEGTSDVSAFESRIESVKKTYEEQVSAITTQMESMKKEREAEKKAWTDELEKLKTHNAHLQRAPILTELSKYEKDPWLTKNVYPNLSLKQLEERVKFVRENAATSPSPYITRMEDVRMEAERKATDFTSAVVEKLEKTDPIMAKLMRGDQLTPEEKRSLGV